MVVQHLRLSPPACPKRRICGDVLASDTVIRLIRLTPFSKRLFTLVHLAAALLGGSAPRAFAHGVDATIAHPECASGACGCKVDRGNPKAKSTLSPYVKYWEDYQKQAQTGGEDQAKKFAEKAQHGPTPPTERTPDLIVFYFDEGQFVLNAAQRQELKQWLTTKGPDITYQSRGYTDACGSTESNQVLGSKRAQSAAELLSASICELGQRCKPAGVESLGESESKMHHEYHRRVEIEAIPPDGTARAVATLPLGVRPTPLLSGHSKGLGAPVSPWVLTPQKRRDIAEFAQRLQASHCTDYLIDASGSMGEVWGILQNHPYPEASKIYVSTTTSCSQIPRTLAQHIPSGDTETFFSYRRLLETLPPKKTEAHNVCLISDYDTVPQLDDCEWMKLRCLAIRKGIETDFIPFGRPPVRFQDPDRKTPTETPATPTWGDCQERAQYPSLLQRVCTNLHKSTHF